MDSGETLDPWRGYRRCLADLPEEGHVCILQDDVLVCQNFQSALEKIALVNSDIPVSLFLAQGGQCRRTYNRASLKYGKNRYVDVHLQDLVHAIGILWPVAKAREFLIWAETNPKRLPKGRATTSDDAMITRWMELTSQRIRCTVPSLVEHPDDVPSMVNKSKMSGGADKARTAAYWIGGVDPLSLDWSR